MNSALAARARLASTILIILALPWLARAQEGVHIVTPGTTSNAPVSPATMNKRIADAAVEYRQFAPIPRIILYDIAFPANAQEYAGLGGHAVLLVTAISQEQAELPLRRVFVRLAGQDIELKSITSVLSKRSEDKSQVLATFGPHRVDALYLFPAHLRLENADLFADFAKNRDGFKLAGFSDSEPPALTYSLTKPPTDKPPSDVTLKQIIRREFPGFIKN